MSPTIIVQFKSFRDEETGLNRVEAKAIDPDTHLPIVSMSFGMFHVWLHKHRYRWVTGSCGVWQRAA